jgi:hypothetical protein
MNRLKFEEIRKGMKVRDSEGNTGTVTLCKDFHNISVKFDNTVGGYGLYCLDPKDKLYYDPLYSANEPILHIQKNS